MKITFKITHDDFPDLQKDLREYEKHCVTYLLHNDKQIYIGETSHLRSRFKSHSENEKKQNLKRTSIITSDFFNKSAIYDIETKLINYMFAEEKYDVLNIKAHQSPHHYYLKESFGEVFGEIWETLRKNKIVDKTLNQLENTPYFKYSPFKELSEEQLEIVQAIISSTTEETLEKGFAYDGSRVPKRVFNKGNRRILINGGPGTGKTLLIIKVIHDLTKLHLVDTSKVAICIPQSNLLSTIKAMVKKANIKVKVIRPVDLSKLPDGELDFLIVDETHRLKKHFNKQAKDLKHLQGGKITELDLALKKAKHVVLMYDSKQTVRPADINHADVQKLKGFVSLNLKQQFRVKNGFNYLGFIESCLQITNTPPVAKDLGEYDFKVVNSIQELRQKILEKEKKHELCRLASGYYKEWISKTDPTKFDFEDEGLKLKWNTTIVKWAHTRTAINEVGCIHTLQGEDLNYAGVIIGDEIYLDPKDGMIKVKKENYYDRNGTPVNGTDDLDEELTKHIKNIYYVLLTRGILGTYLYIKDPVLMDYFERILKSN